MKKVLIILLLLTGLGFAQTAYEIEFKKTFNDTITWVRFSNEVIANVITNQAYWYVDGLKVTAVETDTLTGDTILFHFKSIITKTVIIDYTPPINPTRNAQKNATASAVTGFNLTYTGKEQ